MTRGIISLLILSCLLFDLIAIRAYSAKLPVERQAISSLITRSAQYAFPDEHNIALGSGKVIAKHVLGGATATQSPGTAIGATWYDCQHIGSMGRMIDQSRHGDPDTMIVHLSWMYMPGPVLFARQYRYDNWNAATGSFGTETGLQFEDDFAGFVNIDATEGGRAVVGGHNREWFDGFLDCHFYWDSLPGASAFGVQAQVPRSIAEYGGYGGQEVIWPKFRYQEGASDTVLHVLAVATEVSANDPRGLYYFRKVGADSSGAWDDPPYIVDTVYDIAHDIASDNEGKVALVWVANLPCPGDPCDTCSGYECWNFVQWDNDVYYQISTTSGASWNQRVNVTRNVDGEEGYRPYTDLSALITSDGNLHIVWGARYWPADANTGGEAGLLRGRVFHWSEDNLYIRTVHNFDWDQTICNGGAWQLNASKMTVSECEGKLYVLFVQFNDIPHGIEDDCAAATNPGFPTGAANGELYLTISGDRGLTWDEARNLTNSRTPGCDKPGGSNGACDSDHWPSMARFGSNYSGDFSGAEIVVPPGSSDPGAYYLDVQYLNDHSAGGIVQEEGFWAQADVRWFRIPCVEPIANAQLVLSLMEIDYPAWTKHGLQLDTLLTITNAGNATVNYTITLEEDSGPPGWLSYTGFSGSVSFGLENTETGTVSLNAGGVVNNPGTTVNLVGCLIFTSNAPSSPDTFPICCWVADTLYPPIRDTVHTDSLALTVANTGNFGNQGIGRVNMDYVDVGDCDTTADIYLYDGSPVVGYLKDGDTIVNYSIYDDGSAGKNCFVPIGEHMPTQDMGNYEIFKSGVLVTKDATIALENVWYAPKQSDTCGFVIQTTRVYSYDGQAHSDLTIGEAVDWDIPSDSGSDNGSNFDAGRNLIYQIGGEYNQDDSTECQENDARFGGLMFLECFLVNDSIQLGDSVVSTQYGAYTADNATFVYPNEAFIPQELYANMQDSGYSLYSSTHPDSQLTDLHSVVTFSAGIDLGPADTLIYYTSLATIMNGALANLMEIADQSYQWYLDHVRPIPSGCCIPPVRGNVDYDPGDQVNVADLTYLVDFLFKGGAPPPCEEEGNVDGDADEQINIADLTYLVDYLFKGGSPSPPCP